MSDRIYRITGVVEAGDGTTYRPLYFGGFFDSRRVWDAIRSGCFDRGDGFDLVLDVPATGHVVTRASRPVMSIEEVTV